MNRNTVLLVAAGVAAYLIWKKYGQSPGVGSIIPAGSNLATSWLSQQSAYARVPGTYPAMSTGSVSIQKPSTLAPQLPSFGQSAAYQGSGMSLGPIGSPLPSLGSQRGAGMSMGPIGSPLPSLSMPSWTPSAADQQSWDEAAARRATAKANMQARLSAGQQMLQMLNPGVSFA